MSMRINLHARSHRTETKSMVRLTSSVLMQVQRYVLDVHLAPNIEALREAIPAGAARLIASDRANFNEFDLADGSRLVIPSPIPSYWERLGPVLLQHMYEHPLSNPNRMPPLHQAQTFSDFRHDAGWKRSRLYHDYYIPAGSRFQLFVFLHQRGTMRCSLAFNRERREFSAHDRAVLELVGPHVACAWRRCQELAQLRPEHKSDIGLADSFSGMKVPSLTQRENEVLHWVAEGKRNSEISRILELSPRTVGKHLEHVFVKLGVETRTAAARVAIELRGTRDA
jgi:DNA-binding CsgD family transcriptional regulator